MKNLSVHRFTLPFVFTLASVLLTGCGETRVEVVKPFRPQYEAFRRQLAEMAAMEPKAAVPSPAPLEPKPVLKGNSPESNTAVFMFEQLRDPLAISSAPGAMDFHLSGRIQLQIRTASLTDAQLSGRASKTLRQDLTDALKVRYIAAVKILAVKPPVAADAKSFELGNANGVVMLFDRQTMKLVFADAFNARSDNEVPFSHRKDQQLDSKALQGWLDSNLTSNVRKAALKKFAEGTGGIFSDIL